MCSLPRKLLQNKRFGAPNFGGISPKLLAALRGIHPYRCTPVCLCGQKHPSAARGGRLKDFFALSQSLSFSFLVTFADAYVTFWWLVALFCWAPSATRRNMTSTILDAFGSAPCFNGGRHITRPIYHTMRLHLMCRQLPIWCVIRYQ